MLNRFFAIILLILTLPLTLVISCIILISDGFPIFFIQIRKGYMNSNFNLIKFRTMKKNTPVLATHLIDNPDQYYIKFGKLFRKLSLDEMPQLVNLIKGEMSFVGPRPALYNQDDLIALRKNNNIHHLKPGITGWAQINGRDELTITEKVKADTYYKNNKSYLLDFKIIMLTIIHIFTGRGVSH
jgi:O-antigen biosynthesis protein WbqP